MMSPGSSRTMRKITIEIPNSVGIANEDALEDVPAHGLRMAKNAGRERRRSGAPPDGEGPTSVTSSATPCCGGPC